MQCTMVLICRKAYESMMDEQKQLAERGNVIGNCQRSTGQLEH